MKMLRHFLSLGACLTLAVLSTLATSGRAQSSPFSSPVRVVNSGTSQAVPVVNAAEPFTATCGFFGVCTFPIPTGKRVVIESIAGSANLSQGATLLVRVGATFASGNQSGSSSSGWDVIVPTEKQFSNGVFTFVGFNQKTFLLADSRDGQNLGGAISIANVGGGQLSQVSTTISGYLINSD
jgi:hypothetical protein